MPGLHRNHRTDARAEVLALLAQMRSAARDPARVRALTDQLEVFARSHLEPSLPDPLPEVHLTRKQARLFARLKQDEGRMVRRGVLMDALYFDHVGDEPREKILDVYICKLRLVLRGTGYAIKVVHGEGFILRRIA